jgi:hypothetical protein
MKHFLAITFAVLLAQMSAHARVGETREEIANRYGEGKKMPTQRLAGTESFEYSKSGFVVEVVILDGKSLMEIYSRKEGTSDEAIKELLKVNTPIGTAWRFDKKAGRWERSGVPQLVGYRWPGHPDFFCIKDLKAYEAAEKKNKPNAVGL